MPRTPPSAFAWILFVVGLASLLFSLLAQSRMWQVEFGLRPVAAGGGEYLTALILGGPSLLLALGLLGTSVVWTAWRSVWSAVGLGIAVVPTVAWLFLILRDVS